MPEGISDTNQNNGYGFTLSAIIELWSIKSMLGNPHGRTKIAGCCKGMRVIENMILNVVSQYPNDLNSSKPLFDDLLGVGSGKSVNSYQSGGSNVETKGGQNSSNSDLIIIIVAFVILKFFIGWG